jgi:hypothetical protein
MKTLLACLALVVALGSLRAADIVPSAGPETDVESASAPRKATPDAGGLDLLKPPGT